MQPVNEYDNTYEEEINLVDLLLYCLKKWRWVVAAMLVMAVLAGGYKYYSTNKGNQAAMQQWEDLGIEEKTPVDNSETLQYYQSVIDQNSQILSSQEEYLENSAVMELDARNHQKGTLSFFLKAEDADSESLSALVAAYKAYATDGRLAQLLYEGKEDGAIADSQYLITFSDNSGSGSYADGTGTSAEQPDQGVFQIQIIAEDEKTCKNYMKTAAKGVQAYSEELQEQIGAHTLTLLASTVSESQDGTILDYQLKALDGYTQVMRNLNTLRTEAKTYADSAGAETSEQQIAAPVLASPAKAGIKYGILGLVLGAFLAGFVLIVVFIMNDKLRSTENFEAKYGIRLLGRVMEAPKSKGIFGRFDRWLQRLGEGAYARIPYDEQVKIVSANIKAAIPAKEGAVRVMLAGTMAAQDVAAVCAAVADRIKEVTFSDYRQLIFDASALEELRNYDGVLFLEKKDVSSSRLISQESKITAERDVKILGAVVL